MPSLQEAEEQERAVFDDFSQDDDDDDEDDEELDDDDDDEELDDLDGINTNANDAAPAQPPPPPAPQPAAESAPAPLPEPIPLPPVAAAEEQDNEASRRRALEERQRAFEESRRLFQRLWTEEDELVILQGFHDFVTGRGTVHASHQHDTGPFYDQIRSRLQLDFTKNQLIEKLRRLKKKFRNVVARMTSAGPNFAFKSAHEKATFDIARKIWSSHLKRGRDFTDDDDLLGLPICPDNPDAAPDLRPRSRRGRKRLAPAEVNAPADPSAPPPPPPPVTTSNHVLPPPAAQLPSPNAIEETVRSCLSPFFKELLDSVVNGPCRPALGTPGLGLVPLGLEGGNPIVSMGTGTGAVDSDRWRKQQILELEVFAKRIELVQDQIKSTLEQLHSAVDGN